MNLRLGRQPSEIKFIDWKAYDQTILDYTQAQCVVIGLYDPSSLCAEYGWKPMSEDNTRFITDHLPLSYAASKISFAKQVDYEWDLTTKEKKLEDRAVQALMNMTQPKKKEVYEQLTAMEKEEKETTRKEQFSKLIEMMEKRNIYAHEVRRILQECEHQVLLDLWDLLS